MMRTVTPAGVLGPQHNPVPNELFVFSSACPLEMDTYTPTHQRVRWYFRSDGFCAFVYAHAQTGTLKWVETNSVQITTRPRTREYVRGPPGLRPSRPRYRCQAPSVQSGQGPAHPDP
jgi:hypothetical protein